ncbi:MAG: hypothetical protein Q9M27_06135, partial [Mariprofundaceae bacterium]|nr:hypothetical protein [Mariprofundaceae bacterium]
QASTTQPHARQHSPEGSHPREPVLRKVNAACGKGGALGRYAPCQWRAIGFGTRLALVPWDGSDSALFCGTGH